MQIHQLPERGTHGSADTTRRRSAPTREDHLARVRVRVRVRVRRPALLYRLRLYSSPLDLPVEPRADA